MIIIVLEIVICIIIGIGVIVALVLYNRFQPEQFNIDEPKKIDFLSTSVDEEILVQNALIAYYDQQRNEIIERQKIAIDSLKSDKITVPNNDSGYTSVPSPDHTPHSLYECSGFASMDNLEVSNPLFSSDAFCNHKQVLVTSLLTTK